MLDRVPARHADKYDRYKLRQLLLKLSRNSNILPFSLFLHNVTCLNNQRIESGGNADIYIGCWENQAVALKCVRGFNPQPALHKVCIRLKRTSVDGKGSVITY